MNRTRFRFRNKLLSFDSTTITLCLSLFPWAKFRRQKGGIKLHVLLDSNDYMPSFVHITEAKMHGSKATQLLSLPAELIIALDRAYIDFDLFRKWNEEKVFSVTRMKKECIIGCHGTTKDPPEQQCAQRRDRPSIRRKHLGEISAPLEKDRGMGRQE